MSKLSASYTNLFGDLDEEQKQKIWVNKNYDKMRSYVLHLQNGSNIAIDQHRINSLETNPRWLDKKKIKVGQEFALEYLFSLSHFDMVSIYLLLSVDSILRPLIFTDQSSTVKAAFKRYLSTVLRVLSWYQEDLLDENSEARKNIKKVNQLHCSVLSQMSSKSKDDIVRLTSLENRLKEDIWSSGCPYIKKDVGDISDTMDIPHSPDCTTHFNQYNMALTQYGFLGLALLYPQKVGIHVSQYEMDSFLHLWRYLGYLLGIEDEYNLCAGSYKEIVFKCKAMTELIFKPNLKNVTPEWEHMSHSVCAGMDVVLNQLVFQSTVASLLDALQLKTDQYFKTFSWKTKFNYYYHHFIFVYLIPIKFFRKYFNEFVITKINRAKEKYLING